MGRAKCFVSTAVPNSPVLFFQFNDCEEQRVPLVSTRQRVGIRWWFLCPGCDRRVGTLYCPRGDVRFLCRHCRHVRYYSQRKDTDSFYRPLARDTGIPKRKLRALYHAMGDAYLQGRLTDL